MSVDNDVFCVFGSGVGWGSSGEEWSFGYALDVAKVLYLARIRYLVVIDPNFEVVHVGCFALILLLAGGRWGWWGFGSSAAAKWGC
jgi:hypothetical protein